MGNSSSHNVQEQQFISEHPKLSDAKVISEDNNKWIQACFKLHEVQYDQWTKNLKSGLTKINSDYLLLPGKTNFKHEQGLCGNSGTLTVDYPYYPFLLSELIKQRQGVNDFFKQSDLWYVLYALITAKHDINQRHPKLGDIKPDNIFVNTEGEVKIANCYSWPNQLLSYEKVLDQQQFCYNILLGPEDLQLLSKGAPENYNNKLSQVFAIGATLLCAGILGDFSQVYNYKAKIFNIPAFKDIRRRWVQTPRYSQIFKSIILNLISYNQGDRIQAQELWEWISQYKESILQKKQFVIKRAPSKIQKSFQNIKNRTY